MMHASLTHTSLGSLEAAMIAVMDCQAKLRTRVALGSERFRLRSSESDLSHEFRA